MRYLQANTNNNNNNGDDDGELLTTTTPSSSQRSNSNHNLFIQQDIIPKIDHSETAETEAAAAIENSSISTTVTPATSKREILLVTKNVTTSSFNSAEILDTKTQNASELKGENTKSNLLDSTAVPNVTPPTTKFDLKNNGNNNNSKSNPRLSVTTTDRPRYQNIHSNILFQQQPKNNLLEESNQLLFNESKGIISNLTDLEQELEEEDERTTSPSSVIRRTRILNKNTWTKLGWLNVILLILACILIYFGINICSICLAWCILALRDEDEDERERRKKRAMMKEELGSTAGSERSKLYKVEERGEMRESEKAKRFQEEELTIKVEDMTVASLRIVPSVSSRGGSRNSRDTDVSVVNLDSSNDSLFPLGTVELHRNDTAEESATNANTQILTVLPVGAPRAGDRKDSRASIYQHHSQISLKTTSYHNLGDDIFGDNDRSRTNNLPSVINNYNEEFPRNTDQFLNGDAQLWSIEENWKK